MVPKDKCHQSHLDIHKKSLLKEPERQTMSTTTPIVLIILDLAESSALGHCIYRSFIEYLAKQSFLITLVYGIIYMYYQYLLSYVVTYYWFNKYPINII